MQSIGALNWTNQADPTAPLAVYAVDFSVAQAWAFALQGTVNGTPVTPSGVTVDNTGNANQVAVTVGSIAYPIYANSRQRIDFNGIPNSVVISSAIAGSTCKAQFFVKPPAPNDEGANQVALTTPSFFTGTITAGTANAQTIAALAPAGFSFTNGALISLTVGLTNTGPATLAIGGGSATAIHKLTSSGSVALTGNEMQANANILFSCNTDLGCFDIVGSVITGGVFVGGTTGGTANAQTLAISGYVFAADNIITGIPSVTNTGALTLAIGADPARAVYKYGSLGSGLLVPLTGSEFTLNIPFMLLCDAGAGIYVVTSTPPAIPTVFVSAARTMISLAGAVDSVAHNLGRIPYGGIVTARCLTAEGGYSVGDEMIMPASLASAWNGAANVVSQAGMWFNSTTIGYAIPSGGVSQLSFARKDAAGIFAVTAANWALYFKAW